jgi:hypothetical protein
VRGRFHTLGLAEAKGPFHRLRLADTPPHPDLLPASGEKEQAAASGESIPHK